MGERRQRNIRRIGWIDPYGLCNLGGNRYAAHAFIEIRGKERLCHLSICTDCVLFLANGEEPETWE